MTMWRDGVGGDTGGSQARQCSSPRKGFVGYPGAGDTELRLDDHLESHGKEIAEQAPTQACAEAPQ